MRDWLESLEARERNFVIVGAIVVAVSLIYAFVWQPVATGHAESITQVDRWQRSLSELRSFENMTPVNTARTNRPTSTQPPLVVVDQTLRQRGLNTALRRSSPAGSGIRVEFENVAFDEVVIWLGELSAQHSLHVTMASLSNTPQSGPGRINAVFTLERAL
ncbi:MAG: type II secretion system protein GspM [Pseudomonadota bacterium]